MKARLQGKIERAERAEGQVTLTISFRGKVDGTGPTGREISGDTIVSLAARHADDLKLGDCLTLTLDTESPREGT